MLKEKRVFLLILIAGILVLLICHIWLLHNLSRNTPSPLIQTTNPQAMAADNEPNIGFQSKYHEEKVPLSQIPNYTGIKTKYGITLSPAQEKFLDENRFILLDHDQVSLFKGGMYNFDQWLVDADSMGGGSIYDRKPEDALLVTPDTALHAYHRYFELTLEELEQHELNQYLGNFLTGLQNNLISATKNSRGEVKTRYQNILAQVTLARILFDNKNTPKPDYFQNPEDETKYNNQDDTADSLANAEKLLQKYTSFLPGSLVAAVTTDLKEIYAAQNIGASPLFIQYDPQIKTDYTQFTPRSHYAKNSTLRAYFRTMMYLGRSTYLLGSDLGIGDTNLLVKQMEQKNGSSSPLDQWKQIVAITNFYAGQSDDLSYNEWKSFKNKTIGTTNDDATLISEETVRKMASAIDTLRKPKILSDVVVSEDMGQKTKADLLRQSMGFRIFGQKFTFDAWILNDLTAGQEKTEVKLPSMPSALFVSAALGDKTAQIYSKEFLKRDAGFNSEQVTAFNGKMEQKISDINKVKENEWFDSLGSAWLYVLKTLTYNYGSSYPLYMQSKPFLDKQIQSLLGSYTELKHDTLLYAKQSYAELGAGGDERQIPPIVRGFVEPNILFWNRLNQLIERNHVLFVDHGLFKNGTALDRLEQFQTITKLYQKIAEQELRGEAISDDDYEILRTTRLSFLVQPFTAINPTETSGQTALITDIHTDALSQKILYEATAKPYFMLAIVGNENSPRLVAGLAFNHYEFTDPITTRHTDEWWRAQVYTTQKLPGKNFWYQSLLIK